MKYIKLLMLLFITFSCNNTKENNRSFRFNNTNCKKLLEHTNELVELDTVSKVIKIDLNTTKDLIMASELFEEVKYVSLETNDKSVIGSVSNVAISDSKIFIADPYISSSIKVFESDSGRYMFSLKPSGKGPNEFLSMLTFNINESNKEIVINDDRMSKLVHFDFNGNFIRSQKSKFRFNEFCFLSQGKMIFHTHKRNNVFCDGIKNYGILIQDSISQITKKGARFNESTRDVTFSGFNSFCQNIDAITYNFPLSNEIYVIENDTIRNKYVVDFCENNLPKDFDVNKTDRQFSKKYQVKDSDYAFIYPDGVFEDSIVLHFNVLYKTKLINVFYFKRSGKTLYAYGIKPDMNEFILMGKYVGNIDGKLITYVSGQELYQYSRWLMQNENTISQEVVDKLDNIVESDNGMLGILKFKKQ
ncbi:MAG: 6-bladed beta-propeller [Marinilabiliaceae bacterium]|nr:6-bladed beta-propeller [Marinilabiliaceae bacterium]